MSDIKTGSTRSVVRFSSLADLTVERGGIFDFSVQINGLQYDCRFNEKQLGDRLYVVFNGAVDRQKYTVPVFARWNWHNLYNAPILAISDPILHLDPAIRMGWCAGSKLQDVPNGMVSLIDAFARKIDIEAGRIVCYGSSSGGFAAIAVASRMKQGRFIAYNPQTEILLYYSDHVRDFSRIFNASGTPKDNAAAFPARWSVIRAVSEARELGADLKGVVLQNTVDVFHHDHHYLPFCHAFGLHPNGGSSPDERLHSRLFTDDKGHGPEPADVARRVIDDYIPKLL